MNLSEAVLLLQLQQAFSAWQNNPDGTNIGPTNLEGSVEPSELQMFSSILEALLEGQTGQSSTETELPQKNIPDLSSASEIPSSTVSPVKGKTSFEQIIQQMGQKYGVDPNLIKRVVGAESGFNPQAVSPAGAAGLMQLMPGTAQTYGVTNVFDPAQNIEGGTHFLADLLNRFQGNVPLALAAYNAGPGAVEKYRGIPPYKETQNYVRNILGQQGLVDKEA